MNLSFSTRGWNSMSWDEQVGDASEMGFKGIEPYNIQEYPSLSGKSGAFHPYMQNETMRSLRKAGITLVCFDTSIDLSIADEPLDKAMGILRIAASTKTPYVAFCALREQEEEVRMNLGRILGSSFERVNSLSIPYVVMKSANVISTYIYRVGLANGKYHYATAMGLFQNVIGIILILISDRIAKSMGENGLI